MREKTFILNYKMFKVSDYITFNGITTYQIDRITRQKYGYVHHAIEVKEG